MREMMRSSDELCSSAALYPRVSHDVVDLFLTLQRWDALGKITAQLHDIGATDPSPSHDSSRVTFSLPRSRLPRLHLLCHVERVYATVFYLPIDGGLLAQDLTPIQTALRGVPWSKVLSTWAHLHSTTPRSFNVISKRRGTKRGSRNISGLALQTAVRSELHHILPQYGVHHDPASPCLVVYVRVSHDGVLAGVPLLHKRMRANIAQHKGLHHSLCWAMAATASLAPGDRVLDPMCGRGAVLLEALTEESGATFLGVDINAAQVDLCAQNLAAQGVRRVEVCRGDATKLPLQTASIEVVLCDLPFGRMHGCVHTNASLYPNVVAEIARVLTTPGRTVLLTGSESASILRSALDAHPGITLVDTFPLWPFGLDAPNHVVLFLAAKGTNGAYGWFSHRVRQALRDSSRHSWQAFKPMMAPFTPGAEADSA